MIAPWSHMADNEITLHGVAVAAGEHGILIRGVPGAGKSALAADMIATWNTPAVLLVADDRVWLTHQGGRLIARPHPLIAGQLELRGLGIVGTPALDAVVIRLIVDLVAENPSRLPEKAELTQMLLGQTLPRIVLQAHAQPCIRLRALWSHIRNDLMSV
jgi:HPr kinase/phosphorylase